MNTRRSTYSVLTAAALVAVLTGCSTGDDQPEPVTPENTSTSATPPDDAAATTSNSDGSATTGASPAAAPGETSAAPATSDAATTSTGPESGAALPTVPTDYADALVRAWGSGEQATVERLASPEAVQGLGDHGDAHWDQTSAEGAAGSTIVTYTNTESGDTLELRVDNQTASQGAEHAVAEARYTAAGDRQDAVPTVPTDYADTFVVAWGTDDQPAMARLATPAVIDTLGGHASPHWDRISSEGAAGSTIVTYSETETGDILTLRVQNELASTGAEHAIVEARFEPAP